MAVDPQVLAAIDGAVRADPANRALRLHLVDLLLVDGQHAAALGHCEVMLQQSPDDADALGRKAQALSQFGLPPAQSAATPPIPPAGGRLPCCLPPGWCGYSPAVCSL